jgi:hypothetical protein
MLKRFSPGEHGLREDPEGEFVRIEDAARHFQWHAFNRVLFWIHAREERFFSRGLLHRELIDMRPTPMDEIEGITKASALVTEE